MKKIFECTDYKKWLIILLSFLSFCLVKLDSVKAIFSTNNIFISFLIVLGYGLLFCIIFEMLVAIYYTALKNKIENNINLNTFSNIFRIFIIFLNIIFFGMNKLFVFINFYPVFLMSIFAVMLYFLMFVLIYWVLKKLYIKTNFTLIYFEYAFIFLIIYVVMIGVL